MSSLLRQLADELGTEVEVLQAGLFGDEALNPAFVDLTLDYGERAHSGAQGVGSGVWTLVHLDTATIVSPDPAGAQITNSVDTLQIVKAGIYFAYAAITFDPAGGTGGRGTVIQLQKGAGPNNKYNVTQDFRNANSGTLGAADGSSCAAMFEVTNADIVAGGAGLLTLWCWQDNGGVINLQSSLAPSAAQPPLSKTMMGVHRVH